MHVYSTHTIITILYFLAQLRLPIIIHDFHHLFHFLAHSSHTLFRVFYLLFLPSKLIFKPFLVFLVFELKLVLV